MKDLYEKLEEILILIKDRYKDAKVIIGGDFNDQEPPETLKFGVDLNDEQPKEVVRSSPMNYSRYNIQGRKNTLIDHFFANEKMDVGSMAIISKRDGMKNAG